MSAKRRVVVVVAALSVAAAAWAAELESVKLRIERVALFKNGAGYFVSGAALPDKATQFDLGRLPIPALGTFWVSHSKNVALRGLVTSLEEVREMAPALGFAELLAANIGRSVTVYPQSQNLSSVAGTVVSAGPARPAQEPPSPYLMGPRGRSRDGTPVVVLKTRRGTVALEANSIARVDFEGADAAMSAPVVSKQPRIRMDLEKPAGGEKVTVSYLARGITWAPSYLIDLSDPKTARLTAKALVINEVADLEGAHLDLVTGFPNIRHADISSPVAMSLSLAEFLNALERGRDETGEPHGFVGRQQVLAVRSDGEPEIGNVPQIYEPGTGAAPYSTARAGAEAEDLFLYPVEGFSLRRGETAYLPLFTAEVPYEHIYVWKIPDLLGREERLHEEERRLGRRFAEEVWHSSRLSNTMKLPWTTAPAQFVTGGQIVGQDLCFYTAPGAKSTIRVNRAINLFAEQSEVEVERKPEAASFHGVRYDLVKLKGELKLRNRLGKPATVEVTKELSGEVRETTPKATDTATAKGLKRVNPRHTLVWRICTGSA